MMELTCVEVEQVAGGYPKMGGGLVIGGASIWVGGVAAVGLGLVGAPLFIGVAVGMGFAAGLFAASEVLFDN